jgi:hypothetical protein
MPFYRKKPVVIEAEKLSWDNWHAVCDFAGVGKLEDGKPQGTWLDADGQPTEEPQAHRNEKTMGLLIPTLEGVMIATEGDFIIRGVQGELYPCKPDIFEQTYEVVGD